LIHELSIIVEEGEILNAAATPLWKSPQLRLSRGILFGSGAIVIFCGWRWIENSILGMA
jgi:hypothetical protein